MVEDEHQETDGPLHLAIVGGGVAGYSAAMWAASRGVKVTLFNAGLPLGGTSIHVGTFPARFVMSAATDHRRAERPRFEGLTTTAKAPNWNDIRRARAEASQRIAEGQRAALVALEHVEIVEALASFADDRTLMAEGRIFEPDRVLLTPGSRSQLPDVEGLNDVYCLAAPSLAHLETLPRELIFLEVSDSVLAYAQGFARLGVEVTLLTERHHLLGDHHDQSTSAYLEQVLADDGVDVVTSATITHAEPIADGTRLLGTVDGRPSHWDASAFVVVDHRRPQIDDLGLKKAGVELTEQGFIIIDETLQTTNPRVFAAGDAIGRGSHAYAAAYDAILAARNATQKSRTAGHNTAVPFSIYTDPEFAGVGIDEEQARSLGYEADSAVCELDDVPAAAAAGCRGGFVKLVRDRRSNHLVGARLFAPCASEMVMELALAFRYGLDVEDLAGLVRPPVSLGEAIGRAARKLVGR